MSELRFFMLVMIRIRIMGMLVMRMMVMRGMMLLLMMLMMLMRMMGMMMMVCTKVSHLSTILQNSYHR